MKKTDRELTAIEKIECKLFAKLLKEKAESHEELAHAIDLSPDMISKMKRGKRAIKIDIALRLSEYWKIPVYKISPFMQLRINSAYSAEVDESRVEVSNER